MKKTLTSLATASSVVAIALALSAPIYAQTTYDTSGTATTSATTDTTNTGATTNTSATALPNTGAGGEAATNAAILLTSGLVAVGGATLLARKMNKA